MNTTHEDIKERIYLPSQDSGIDAREYLNQYIDREFPEPKDDSTSAVYSIPIKFKNLGEKQASLAEENVFFRFHGLTIRNKTKSRLWLTFFHSASYAGHSFRNQRVGKLMIREHDFVVFAKYDEKYFVILTEVKSTNDHNTSISNLEKTSDAKVIKNNKRSAQHQLRDHMEVLQGFLATDHEKNNIQCYIMWPFLGAYTKDPKQQIIKRWKEDKNLHVFEDTISDQDKFNDWFFDNVLSNEGIEAKDFITLLNRYIILSCGVFVNEINEGMMALLTQEQLQLLTSNKGQTEQRPLVVHGAAGTGKTLLVLRKLQQLHQIGQLNEHNRALYICYWPGIRCEIEMKLEILGIRQYVDTARFYISSRDFLEGNNATYKHIFMDESEALCLAFEGFIIQKTIAKIYQRYHDGNCLVENCKNATLELYEDIQAKIQKHNTETWGELWFAVDINQATVFLPKHSPQMLKVPHIILNKVMRSTGYIFNVFKQFYTMPITMLAKVMPKNMKIPNIIIGHHINGPPVYWTNVDSSIDITIAKVIIDLCSSKGFKPNELCVLPFLINEKFAPGNINRYIDQRFVENGYRPKAVWDVENYLKNRQLNDFLIAWALRVKGLEFKVVIMAIDDDDFDYKDYEDRKKAYVISSRCTSLLILISNESVRNEIDFERVFQNYPFSINFDK